MASVSVIIGEVSTVVKSQPAEWVQAETKRLLIYKKENAHFCTLAPPPLTRKTFVERLGWMSVDVFTELFVASLVLSTSIAVNCDATATVSTI